MQRGGVGVAGVDAAAVADLVAGPVAERLAAPVGVPADAGALGWPAVVGLMLGALLGVPD